MDKIAFIEGFAKEAKTALITALVAGSAGTAAGAFEEEDKLKKMLTYGLLGTGFGAGVGFGMPQLIKAVDKLP
jgi:hypothetical protein